MLLNSIVVQRSLSARTKVFSIFLLKFIVNDERRITSSKERQMHNGSGRKKSFQIVLIIDRSIDLFFPLPRNLVGHFLYKRKTKSPDSFKDRSLLLFQDPILFIPLFYNSNCFQISPKKRNYVAWESFVRSKNNEREKEQPKFIFKKKKNSDRLLERP